MVTAVLNGDPDTVTTTSNMGSTPLDLLRAGPVQFRERMLGQVSSAFERTDRKSAVEQLEASKIQYVKSDQVLDHRQLPKNCDSLHIGRSVCRCKSMLAAETEASLAEGHSRRRVSFPPPRSRDRREANSGRGCCVQNERVSCKTPCVTDGRHADTTHCVVIDRMAQCTDKPRLMDDGTDSGSDVERLGGTESSGQLVNTESCMQPPVIVRRFRKSMSRSRSELMKRHSSSSDVSARLSRNSVDLERFFNSMGLEQSVLAPMLSEPTVHAPSASTVNLCDCSSSLTSANPRSVYSDDSRNDPLTSRTRLDKTGGPATSIVERNARIIKWLYGVKKAQPPRRDGSLTQ